MSDRDLDPAEYDEIPDESEQLDQDPYQPDSGLEDRGVDDALDEGLTTPENWSVLARRGDHETLDERLAEEEPDSDDSSDDDDFIDDGEVGRERAGRLIDPNEGIGDDEESELIGEDVGIDGSAASAEEAAVHVVDSPDERG
ncbi:hypothetical protein GCM10011575_21750 [Microlunatus endophyticus]|uniref:DUF5709 domain-containing protein n=1 Tax=Microlunatus endophyticus TaxID=1716077 RepID=A0A917W3A7_9ACTN|nr:DUF5709 domain-containing protein [Microlunatus endophyticus]GGL62918.1 hypothetical protein GCM10011575_21750 [Microlunatus endophyticus]